MALVRMSKASLGQLCLDLLVRQVPEILHAGLAALFNQMVQDGLCRKLPFQRTQLHKALGNHL